MMNTHVPVFDRTLQKAHQWLEDLMRLAHYQDEAQAYSAMRAVLHALRDRLSAEEAAQLAAQFPMLLRGMFFEGWRPNSGPTRQRHVDEFLGTVSEGLRANRTIDPLHATRSVFLLLNEHIAAGEIEDVRGLLPRELRDLWPTPAASHAQ
jgi:uncharacterized protein (DUF2267 family)